MGVSSRFPVAYPHFIRAFFRPLRGVTPWMQEASVTVAAATIAIVSTALIYECIISATLVIDATQQ